MGLSGEDVQKRDQTEQRWFVGFVWGRREAWSVADTLLSQSQPSSLAFVGRSATPGWQACWSGSQRVWPEDWPGAAVRNALPGTR